MLPLNGVLQWGFFSLAVTAIIMAVFLQYLYAWKGRPSGALSLAKASLFDNRVAFEVKLTLFSALAFLYPLMLVALMLSKPTMRFWCGQWLLSVIVVVPAWLLIVHLVVARGTVSRAMTPLLAILVPAAFLAFVCQVHVWWFGGQGVALQAHDCQSWRKKAELEASWQDANTLFEACVASASERRGLPLREAALVIRLEECTGYSAAFAAHQQDWSYLRHLEEEYRCGGWCAPAAPLWYAQPLRGNSCSKVAARVMDDGVFLRMRQISTYSALLLLAGCLALFLSPVWLTKQ